ncbi:MAG: bacillithiol system redox-active protein YtxJ [Cyclobacteriaceae bacterium]
MNWLPLTSEEQLSTIDELSGKNPILIFKHSTRCSISAAALNRLERKWDDSKAGNIEAYFLDLIAQRNISNEISLRYNVMHQSPQILIVVNGKCIYDNSHLGISFDEISDVITELNPA